MSIEETAKVSELAVLRIDSVFLIFYIFRCWQGAPFEQFDDGVALERFEFSECHDFFWQLAALEVIVVVVSFLYCSVLFLSLKMSGLEHSATRKESHDGMRTLAQQTHTSPFCPVAAGCQKQLRLGLLFRGR